MHQLDTPNAPDPFQSPLDTLNQLAAAVAPIATDVDSLVQTLSTIDDVLKNVQTLSQDLDEAITAIDDVRNLCASLTEIPGIGGILDTVSSVLGDVSHAATPIKNALDKVVDEVVNPAQSFIADASSGVTHVDTILRDITTDVPAFTNTIAILQAMAGIAQGLSAALANTDVASRLNNLLTTYGQLRADVESGVKDVNDVLDALKTTAHAVAPIFNSLLGKASSITDTLADVQGVARILDPIRKAFNALETAFAPVAWALDAASCVMDEVITPVIDQVLDWTGLRGLVDGLESKINAALGLDAVTSVTDVLKALQVSGLSEFNDAGTQVMALDRGWATASDKLGQYSMNKDQARDQAMQQLVDAVTAAPAGSGGGPIRPWPRPPAIFTPPSGAPKPAPSLLAAKFDAIAKSLAVVAPSGPRKPFALAAPAPPAPASLPPLGPQWVAVTDFGAAVDATVQKLGTLTPQALSMKAKAAAFPTSLALPGAFGAQIADVKTALKTAADFLDLIAQSPLPEVASILAPFQGTLHDQLSACDRLTDGLSTLGGSLPPVRDAVTAAATHAPTTTVIADASGNIAGWKSGADALARTIDAGRAAKQAATVKADLDASTRTLLDRVNKLGGTLTALDTAIDQVEAQMALIDGGLVAYGSALTVVTKQGQLIAGHGQATADQVAHLLHVIDSLLSPLTLLMQTLHCTAPQAKAAGNDALKAVKVVAVDGAKSATGLVQTLLDKGLALVLPLGQLETDVTNAQAILTGAAVSGLPAAAKSVGDAMDALTAALQDSLTYTVTPSGGGAPVQVPNQFVNADSAQSAANLAKTLANPSLIVRHRADRKKTIPMSQMTTPEQMTWSPVPAPGLTSVLAVGDTAAGSPAPPDMTTWKNWRDAFAIADGVMGALKDLITSGKIPIKNLKLKADIFAALFGFNEAVVNVDTDFFNFINNPGQDPFTLDPPPIAPWPHPESAHSKSDFGYFEDGLEIFAGALGLVQGTLKQKLKTHPELTIIVDAFISLINAKDEILKVMKEILEPTPKRLIMIPEFAQKTGLFHVKYTIAPAAIGGPVFFVSMTVNTVDKAIDGAGRVIQATNNPPLDVRTRLHCSYAPPMTIIPEQSHILVFAAGQGAIGIKTPLTGTNVELFMILSSDWSSGVASYKYMNAQGTWSEVLNVPVHLDC